MAVFRLCPANGELRLKDVFTLFGLQATDFVSEPSLLRLPLGQPEYVIEIHDSAAHKVTDQPSCSVKGPFPSRELYPASSTRRNRPRPLKAIVRAFARLRAR